MVSEAGAGIVAREARLAWSDLAVALDQCGPAPCESGEPPEVWWEPEFEDLALLLCRTCRARAECLSYAMAAGEPAGVWGGVTASNRRAVERPQVAS